jgi:hypothetical protein
MATTMHWLPKAFAPGIDRGRDVHRGGVDADLVRAGQQHFAHVFHRADAAADGQRDETMLGGAADHIDHRLARLSEEAVMSRNTSSSASCAL